MMNGGEREDARCSEEEGLHAALRSGSLVAGVERYRIYFIWMPVMELVVMMRIFLLQFLSV